MFVKPVAGLIVPDPERGGHLPAQGADVPDNTYWHRRLNDGDVVASASVATAVEANDDNPV